VALRMAAAGACIAVWDTQTDGAEQTASLCRGKGAQSLAWRVDVGVADEVESAVAAFEREWGRPDGLVNNAGIFPRARALDMELSEWERVLRVNLTGTFLCARAVARAMKEAGKGVIVNMASGRAPPRGLTIPHPRGGIIALTKSLALDWAPYGIRVNCVIPGVTDTAQPRGELSDDELYALGSRIPLGRIAQPQDIAAAVAFLLGDDSAYMTGQSIAVNGGAIMLP
jgi:NAD(P)-dependent dehydrogenase (short-subunit alcohol dehydrogenase family)